MIQNRDTFLQTIAKRLGHSTPLRAKPERNWRYLPQQEVLADASVDELVEIFVAQCANIHTKVEICDVSSLQATLQETFTGYGGGSIVYSEDPRFAEMGVADLIAQQTSFKWNPASGAENIEIAEQANIGIVVSDLTLAESGTILLQSSAARGRTISFLPENSIAIVPKSSLVPRMTQAAQFLRQQDHVASCINFISGPSNSADIEMNLVVGVHGPVRMTYILVEDW